MRVHAIDVTAQTADPVSTLNPTVNTNMKVPTNSAKYFADAGGSYAEDPGIASTKLSGV
jgi:hypothetical protein